MKDKKMKDNIIQHADKLFKKFGYNKTTMNDIAKSMGKSKSSLYHYYSHKEEIYKDVISREFNILKEKLLNEINKKISPIDKLHTYTIVRIKLLSDIAIYYTHFNEEYYLLYDFNEKIRKDFDKEEVNIITNILIEGVQENIFKIKTPKQLAEAFLIVLKGYEYKWAINKPNKELEKNIRSLFEILLNGIMIKKDNI